MIMADDYYITNLDIIIVGTYYKAPIIIITGTRLKELSRWKIDGLKDAVLETKDNVSERSKKRKKMWIVNKSTDFYYFIKQPGIKRNEIPKYKLISSKENTRSYIKDMKKSLKTLINFYKKRPTFEQYVENYRRFVSKSKKNIKLKVPSSTKPVSEVPIQNLQKSKTIPKKTGKKIKLT